MRILAAILIHIALAAVAAASAPAWMPPPGFTVTRGGDAGRILEVTTLAATGPGSLAAALAAEGPRKIVFTVGGVIDLASATLRLRPRARRSPPSTRRPPAPNLD